MTVEQSPLPVRSAQRTREDDSSLIYAKVREVTGAPDNVIEEAIKACIRRDGTYKVEDVVTTIIADDSVVSSNKPKSHQTQSTSGKLPVAAAMGGGDPASGTTSTSTSMAGDGAPTVGVKRLATSAGNPVAQAKQDPNHHDFVDLTRDTQVILGGQVSREEQDISRVLEQSLAESKGSGGTNKRKRGDLWFTDPLNPHERKRQDGWPVGLKNVGNTCWFSAVIQSLFHIREFQNLVLAFNGEEGEEESSLRRNIRFMWELKQLFALLACSTRKYVDPSKAVNILKEDSSGAGADGQQDVSEFQHKLLDWLEDAFSIPVSSCATMTASSSSSSSATASTSSSEAPSTSTSSSAQSGNKTKENPMKRLFLGKYKAEGVNEGKVFHQEVTFGQYPLNVLGFGNIHESLEATMAQAEIETVSGSGQKSGQEIWFTHLPVVLTFELSRFGFNAQLNQAEKIHQQLFFPQVIYMDRYLECNKSYIRQKREEARKLRDQLSCLQHKLDKFMNYGSSSKRYPLPDVLQYALDFAQSTPVVVSPSTPLPQHHQRQRQQQQQHHHHHPNDVDMEPSSPMLSTSRQDSSSSNLCQDVSMSSVSDSPSILQQTPPPPPTASATSTTTTSTTTARTASVTAAASQAGTTTTATMATTTTTTTAHSGTGDGDGNAASSSQSSNLDPCPREVTESELRVLQDCLRRWRTEVEADVRELQKNISGLEGKLSSLYSDSSMKKYPYHLHAVLVHEGQAVSGHYWSFIYDDVRGSWLKFNDITVSQSSWEEMHKESVGGFHNASAYCLMYVDRSRLQREQQGDSPRSAAPEARTLGDSLSSLPDKLRLMVEEDNTVFQQELEGWDNKQRNSASTSQGLPSSTAINNPSASCASSSSQSSSATRSPPPPSSSSPFVHPLSAATATSSGSASASAASTPHSNAPAPTPANASTNPTRAGHGVKVRTMSGNDADVTVTGEQRPGEASIIRPLNQDLARLTDFHAKLSFQATLAAVRDVVDGHKHRPNHLATAEVLEKAMSTEIQRLRQEANDYRMKRTADDVRLTHPVLYLIASGADVRTIDVVLSEQFSLCALVDSIHEGVWRKAQEQYSRLYHAVGDKGIRYYEFWHRRYSHYRQAVARLVVGLEAYCQDRYQEALSYLTQAWLHNCQPGLDAATMATGGINPSMLAYFRRCSLQRLNEMTMKMFESESDMTDSLTIMTQQILPSLSHILSSNIQEDVKTAEEIREKWCQFLEKDLDAEKIERLQDFLSKMFEISGVVYEDPEPVRWNELGRDLHKRYAQVMEKVKDKGELSLCLEGS